MIAISDAFQKFFRATDPDLVMRRCGSEATSSGEVTGWPSQGQKMLLPVLIVEEPIANPAQSQLSASQSPNSRPESQGD